MVLSTTFPVPEKKKLLVVIVWVDAWYEHEAGGEFMLNPYPLMHEIGSLG